MRFKTNQFYNLKMSIDRLPRLRTGVCWINRAAFLLLSGLLLAIGVLIPCSAARGAQGRQVLWNFDRTLTSSLGGGYNSFSREPSWARTYLDATIHRPVSGHSLRITAHREWHGFCGVWFSFYSLTSQRQFDARPYRYLSFWIKGQNPGGDFDIKLVDARGEQHEDSLDTRPLHAYLPAGITTSWQKVTLPLADFPATDPGSLIRFVLVFSVPGDYKFYIDDISFESVAGGRTAARPVGGRKRQTASEPNPYHSMWVWKTQDFLKSSRAANRLFDFCYHTGVKEIYFSVDFESLSGGPTPASIENPAAYGDFLSAAHLRGLRVEALAGAPGWAADTDHRRALGAVRAILSFNATMTPDARFDGIHFDVEPYLMLSFAVPDYRKQIFKAYLEMLAECAKTARKGHAVLTADIPWWFYPTTPATRENFTVNFHGKDKTVGQHVTDLLHSVTIMDYRNEADGAGGIISFGIPALAYAAKVHKKILVGVETSAEKETPVEFDLVVPAKSFQARLQETHLAASSSFEGYEVHALSAKGVVFVGLGPQRSDTDTAEPIATALADLRALFRVKSSDQLSIKALLDRARETVDQDAAWKDFQPVELRISGPGQGIPAFRAIHRTPPVTTFHGLGRNIFEQESRSAAEWLGSYSSFGGLAIHYYRSFRVLMATPPVVAHHGFRFSGAQ